MDDQFYRKSTVTGRSYDVFKTVKILNIQQACSYMDNDVFPVDIKVSIDQRSGKKCLVFYFDREESKDVYDKWCNYELK